MMIRESALPELLAGEYLIKRYGATIADYERLADEDTRLELLDGVLILQSAADMHHEDLFGFLLVLLRMYAQRRRRGMVRGSRTAMILQRGRRFEPDLLFLKQANAGRCGKVSIRGPADLVIEILSPATRDYDLGDKRKAYAKGGIPELWLIDLPSSVFLVDRPAGTQLASMEAGRYESRALPGFWLDVDWLWQRPLPDPDECLAKILGSRSTTTQRRRNGRNGRTQ